ncbi:hypothetical protein GCM10022224_043600 [Nonomuraea antimicrobica]|uniref:Golgi phosphoprotein 3 (GPP34) n=1 Tax=Nonomuraea antimicrobica TaxID=561173 RepID=A0ABP7BZP5_9ACTN
MDLLIAEEILLLAYRPKGTPLVNLELLDHTLSAAVLSELCVLDRLVFEGGRLRPIGSGPVGDAELDTALAQLAVPEEPPEFGEWWQAMSTTPRRRERLLGRLEERGAIRAETRTYLRLFKEEVFAEADPAFRDSVKERVPAALAEAEPDRRMVALVSLAHAAGLVAKVFPKADRRRAADLAGRDRLGAVVAVAFKNAAAQSVGKMAGGVGGG